MGMDDDTKQVQATVPEPTPGPPTKGFRWRSLLIELCFFVVGPTLLLLAVIGPHDVGYKWKSSPKDTALSQMVNLGKAIDLYQLSNHGQVPRSLNELLEKDEPTGWALLESIPDDPWGTPYSYRVQSPKGYTITSAGPDRKPGTADDLRWPRPD